MGADPIALAVDDRTGCVIVVTGQTIVATLLFEETGDLETTARHRGHAHLDTTRIYAKWSDRRLREAIGRW